MKGFDKKNLFIIVLVAISLMGSSLIIALTSKRGIGLSAHGPEYIRMATSLIDSNSVSQDPLINYWQHFPPLYPLLLGMIKWLGGPDPLFTARWLNSFLFGINIFLVGLLIYKQTDSKWLALTGALWMLFKIDIVQIHSVVMTEPLFISEVLLWLLLFVGFLENRRVMFLLGFSLMAGLACTTRFAGIPLILVSMFILFNQRRKGHSNFFTTVVIFLSVSLSPMILWMSKNYIDGGRFVNRILAFHPASLPFNQYRWPINPSPFNVVPLLVVITLIGWLIFKKRDPLAVEAVFNKRQHHLVVAIVFIFVYFVGWFITISFLDAEAYLVRYFIPIQIFELFFCFSFVGILLSVTKSSKMLRIFFCFFISIYLIGMNLTTATQWFKKRYREGEEYDGGKWDNSQIVQESKKIPKDIEIYTNNVEALYVRANRQAIPLTFVSKVDMISLKNNPFYSNKMSKMKADLKSKKAVVVYFYSSPQNDKLPTIDELNNEVPLKLILKTSDGGIYVANDY